MKKIFFLFLFIGGVSFIHADEQDDLEFLYTYQEIPQNKKKVYSSNPETIVSWMKLGYKFSIGFMEEVVKKQCGPDPICIFCSRKKKETLVIRTGKCEDCCKKALEVRQSFAEHVLKQEQSAKEIEDALIVKYGYWGLVYRFDKIKEEKNIQKIKDGIKETKKQSEDAIVSLEKELKKEQEELALTNRLIDSEKQS